MNKAAVVFCFLSLQVSTISGLTLDEKCFQSQNKTVVVHYWDKVPFIYHWLLRSSRPKGFFAIIIKEALKQCCLATANIRFVEIESIPGGIQEFMEREEFDLLMPVTSFPGSLVLRGLPYVSIAESSRTAVLMLANASGAKLLLSGLQAWPILVFIIVSAMLAGVLMWLSERNGKFNQFSEEFGLGIFEGFWWAFCTMTTVGYGDKAPKTILGKALGSIWMLVGVIIVTMFISIITTSLTSANYGQYTCIRGRKVSVVNQSSEHTLAIRSNAQVFVAASQQEAFDDMLTRRVEASLIDTHALKSHISGLAQHHVVVSNVLENYVSYGVMLSKHSSRLESCVREFMSSNEVWRFELLREAAGGRRVYVSPAEDYFGSGGIFSMFVYSGVACFVLVFMVGLIWECHKSRTKEMKSYFVNHKLSVQPTNTNKGILANGTSSSIPIITVRPSRKPSPPTPPQSHGNTPWEKLLSRQKMEVIELENDFYRFEKEWEKRYKDLQRTVSIERAHQNQTQEAQ